MKPATLTRGDSELSLLRALSASGARYADERGNEFWNHGNESLLTLAGSPQQSCQAVLPAARY